MKSAAVILLLGVFVCGVVCDPIANDGKQQTAETEYYPGPGRSRDNDYEGRGRRGDGDYGYNRRGDGGYRHDDGYKHHDSFPEHPARSPLCACQRDLDKRTLFDKNGCGGAPCAAPSGYCTEATNPAITATLCPCATTGNYGTDATFGSCFGNYGVANGGALCIEATCPNDGSIRIQGQAVPKTGACSTPVGGCPAANDFLYVYRGTLATNTPLFTVSQQDVDTTVSCTKGEIFQICEKDGVMVTSSVKFTYTGQTTGACNMLGAGDNWRSLGCTP